MEKKRDGPRVYDRGEENASVGDGRGKGNKKFDIIQSTKVGILMSKFKGSQGFFYDV